MSSEDLTVCVYKEEDVTNECHSFPPFPYTSQLDHYSNVTKDDVSNPAAAVGVGLMLPGFYTLLLCGEERPTTSLRRD